MTGVQTCALPISELQIESTEEIAWTLDGEFGGRHSRVEIRNYKQALEIRVPEEE